MKHAPERSEFELSDHKTQNSESQEPYSPAKDRNIEQTKKQKDTELKIILKAATRTTMVIF